jgi:hypothetical protein
VQTKASHCLFTKEIYTVWQNLSKLDFGKNLIGISLGAGIREGDWEKFGMEEKRRKFLRIASTYLHPKVALKGNDYWLKYA